MGLAADFRQACADALAQAGPDAPTLCEGWKTRDLAVHVVLRDRRPDVVLTSFLPQLNRWAKRVKQGYTAKPYDDLVAMVRRGAPVSPLRVPALDELANVVEFYVHTEDVVRAARDWTPSEEAMLLPAATEDVLWWRLQVMGRLLCLKAPTGIEFVRTGEPRGGADGSASAEGPSTTAHPATKLGTVRVLGRPGELLLFAFGRSGAAQVELDGSASAVSALRKASLGF